MMVTSMFVVDLYKSKEVSDLQNNLFMLRLHSRRELVVDTYRVLGVPSAPKKVPRDKDPHHTVHLPPHSSRLGTPVALPFAF